jgi:hypothetical protein
MIVTFAHLGRPRRGARCRGEDEDIVGETFSG